MADLTDPFLQTGFGAAVSRLLASGKLGGSAGGTLGQLGGGAVGGGAGAQLGGAAGAQGAQSLGDILAAANTARGQGLPGYTPGAGGGVGAGGMAGVQGAAQEGYNIGQAVEGQGVTGAIGGAAPGLLGQLAARGWGAAPGLIGEGGGSLAGGAIGAGVQVAAPLAAGAIGGYLVNKLTPASAQHDNWSRFLQGALPGAAAGAVVPGANIVTMPLGAAIGGIGNVVKSGLDDRSAMDSNKDLDKQYADLTSSVTGDKSLTDLQRKQFGVLIQSAMGQLDKQFPDKISSEYVDARKQVITNAQSLVDQAKLQNSLSDTTSTQKGYSAQDQMALQAAISQVIAPIISQSQREVQLGNDQLTGIANRSSGDLRNNILSQIAIRQQNNQQQGAAFAGSLQAQLQLQTLEYQRQLQNQMAQQQTAAMMQAAGGLNSAAPGGLFGGQNVSNPLLAMPATR